MKSALSPKELGAAIGVSESSLKRWADSGRLDVARTAGGHRRIRVEEAIRFVREHGFALARPAILGLEELDHGSTQPAHDDPASAVHDALAAGDGDRARAIVLTAWIEGMPLSLIVDRLLAPAMRAIGERWRHGEDGILVEHRAAELCGQVLARIRGLAIPDDDPPVAVGGAPEDDPYVLPSLMAASVLASEGWRETNLSAHTPMNVIARGARDAGAQLVWVAFSTGQDRAAVRDTLGTLRQALTGDGARAAIVAGGPALDDGPPLGMQGVYHAHSMTELAAFAQGLRSHRRTPADPA